MKKTFFALALSAVLVSCGTVSRVGAPPPPAPGQSDDIGYGKVDRNRNAYSAGTVKIDDRQMSTYSNIFEYLKGRVPGLEVGTAGPGGVPSVRIRGNNSLHYDSGPLILLDGTEVTDISSLNPADVSSVDILKDASTSIYGSRAAGGVIMIKTKSAQEAAARAAAEKKAARQARRAEGKTGR